MSRGAASRLHRALPGLVAAACLATWAPAHAGPADYSPFANVSEFAAGPDGQLWFAQDGPRQLGHISANGHVTTVALSNPSYEVTGLASGPLASEWFVADVVGSTPKLDSVLGRVGPDGRVTTIPLNSEGPGLLEFRGLAAGRDGNLWTTDSRAIFRVSPQGTTTRFSAGLPPNARLGAVSTGPDGAIWFSDGASGVSSTAVMSPGATPSHVGRIATDGRIDEFQLSLRHNEAISQLVTGPDGNLWFLVFGGDTGRRGLGRVTPRGHVTIFRNVFSRGMQPADIASGRRSLWVTFDDGALARVSITRRVSTIARRLGTTEGEVPSAGVVAVGADGAVWVDEKSSEPHRIARVTPAGVVREFPRPKRDPCGGFGDVVFRARAVIITGRVGRYRVCSPPNAKAFNVISLPQEEGALRAHQFQVRARWLGFEYDGGDPKYFDAKEYLGIYDLRSHRLVSSFPEVSGYLACTQFILSDEGGFAEITQPDLKGSTDHAVTGIPGSIVRAAPAPTARPVTLDTDSGQGIPCGSLRLDAGVVSWTHGDQQRSAPFASSPALHKARH